MHYEYKSKAEGAEGVKSGEGLCPLPSQENC